MPERTTLVVVDDHPLYRAGVVRTLADAPDLRVLGEGDSADDALELVRRVGPNIVLLDISMPGGGVSAARHIADEAPGTAIIMLTASENDDDIMESLAAGARGYVLKGVGAHDLLTVVRAVAAGGSYVSPSLAGRLLITMKAKGTGQAARSPLDALTDREEEILRQVAAGKSNKEVGRALGLQEKTVKHYMTSILQKLQLRNRTEAALFARDNLR